MFSMRKSSAELLPARTHDANEDDVGEGGARGDELARREDEEKNKKAKISEGSYVLQMQREEIAKLQKTATRTFKRMLVPIKTVGGGEMWVWAWGSEHKPMNKSKRERSPAAISCTCEVCGRTFLDKRRLAIHKNVHLKASAQLAADRADEDFASDVLTSEI